MTVWISKTSKKSKVKVVPWREMVEKRLFGDDLAGWGKKNQKQKEEMMRLRQRTT